MKLPETSAIALKHLHKTEAKTRQKPDSEVKMPAIQEHV
jgi:hypothetical protein